MEWTSIFHHFYIYCRCEKFIKVRLTKKWLHYNVHIDIGKNHHECITMNFHLGKAMDFHLWNFHGISPVDFAKLSSASVEFSQDVESGALPKIPRRAFWSIVARRSGFRIGNHPHLDLSSGSGQNPQMCFSSCRCTVKQFQYMGRPDHKALVWNTSSIRICKCILK